MMENMCNRVKQTPIVSI